jgi:hypothetical protein
MTCSHWPLSNSAKIVAKHIPGRQWSTFASDGGRKMQGRPGRANCRMSQGRRRIMQLTMQQNTNPIRVGVAGYKHLMPLILFIMIRSSCENTSFCIVSSTPLSATVIES